MKVMVTGGCGFIGSALCQHLVNDLGHQVVNIDKMTYAATEGSTAVLRDRPSYRFYRLDICEQSAVEEVMASEEVDGIVHLAAESHVDRSIDGPRAFIDTNVVGTYSLLEAARAYHRRMPAPRRQRFRFHHVSTDEVFGELPLEGGQFSEATAYAPSSPYAASKAASDHLVMAWHRTYGLPVVLSNCSNNYGPYQFPEKLIPLTIINALEGKPLPVYGTGKNIRDWLHVEDHARALALIFARGELGQSYMVGARAERSTLQVVERIADILDRELPSNAGPRRNLVKFVADRPGHDLRYAVDPRKVEDELGWTPRRDFDEGLRDTVRWYVKNPDWWRPLRASRYSGERLGQANA